MMSTQPKAQRSGFTLVEFLIVAVLAAGVIGAVYETLLVQERSYAAGGEKLRAQESLRTSLGILESELREAGSIGDSAIGGSDFIVAAADSVVFRAQRKIGFVCKLSRGESWAVVWPLGDAFAANDTLLVFVDGETTSIRDDGWSMAVVGSASDHSDSDCASRWPDQGLQILNVGSGQLNDVYPGAPVRSYQTVTYGIYPFEQRGWGLGRRTRGSAPQLLVGGLATPGSGLRFTYYDDTGTKTNDVTAISRLRIDVRTDPPAKSGVDPTTLTTNLYLRNN